MKSLDETIKPGDTVICVSIAEDMDPSKGAKMLYKRSFAEDDDIVVGDEYIVHQVYGYGHCGTLDVTEHGWAHPQSMFRKVLHQKDYDKLFAELDQKIAEMERRIS